MWNIVCLYPVEIDFKSYILSNVAWFQIFAGFLLRGEIKFFASLFSAAIYLELLQFFIFVD